MLFVVAPPVLPVKVVFVTAAMLSFVFIKAFAILDGYSIVALLRIPICLTLAVWIASHWCKFDAMPDVRFGA